MYERERTTTSGYKRTETHYHCNECDGCHYREACMAGKNWKRPVEQRYQTLTVSKEFERLRAAEYVLYAMAHNLGWLHSRIQNDKLGLHLYELKPSLEEAA